MAVPYHTHNFTIPVASKEETAGVTIGNKVVVPSSLGTAAVRNEDYFATAEQGDLAASAVQPARQVATGTGLTGGGSLASDRTIALSSASIASLEKADTAVQPSTFNDTIAGFDGPDVIANRNASTGEFSATFDAEGNIATSTETYASATITTTYGYTDGNLTTLTATDGTDEWVQTLTYDDDGNLESISEWVLQ